MLSKPRRIKKRSPALLPLLGLVFLSAGAATWFLLPPPIYTARMELHVASDETRVVFNQGVLSAAFQNEAFMRNQAFMIRDLFVLTAALRDPEVANLSLIKEQTDPLQWLRNNITVEFPDPETLHICLTGLVPRQQIKIVNVVTKSYFDNVVNKEKQHRRDHIERLAKLEAKFKKDLQVKQEKLRVLQGRAGMMDEFEATKEMMKKAADERAKLEVEKEAPTRITQPCEEAVLYTPDATKRGIMMDGAAALTGLGILLLIVATYQFRADKAHEIVVRSPTLSAPQ